MALFLYRQLLKLAEKEGSLSLVRHAIFLRDYFELRRQAKGCQYSFPFGKFYPCLEDRCLTSGTAYGHYFHQDLLVANRIFANNPEKHVDVGSRLDGFIAHVASFRELEVFDIRPLDNTIPNIRFKEADLMSTNFSLRDYCDSVSSLHAIEHFGLGRYGDRIDYNGHLKGFDNIYKMLKEGGKFYFSVPIGRQRIEFNAHRVFSVKYLLEVLEGKYRIDSFSYVNDKGDLVKEAPLNPQDIEKNYSCNYGCAIFELTKTAELRRHSSPTAAAPWGVGINTSTGDTIRPSQDTSAPSIRQTIKDVIMGSFFYDRIQDWRSKKNYRRWLNAGRLMPPPHAVKQMTVKEYAKKNGTRVFVETGTYLGDMVSAIKNNFHRIYSIELSPKLYEEAKNRFYNYKHISILKGDSSKVLPEILKHVEEPCLFWLDSHYSAGITAKGEKETPILEELKHIFDHPAEDHVILIDDARCFNGRNDYSTLEELRQLVLSRYPNYIFEVTDDIIRCHDKTAASSPLPQMQAFRGSTRAKISQAMWGRVHKWALNMMNIGPGGSVERSGELWVIDYVKRHLAHKGVVFDVGANVGDYAMALLCKLGERAEIYCFEPSKEAFRILTTKLDKWENVSLFNFGFGDREESATLYSNAEGSGLASLYDRRLDHFGIEMKCLEEVQLRKLDDFCMEKGIGHIDLLKIDAEGNELKVLHGAKNLIESNSIDMIQFEFGGCNIDSRTYFQDFYYYLNRFYKIHRILKVGVFPIESYEETHENFVTTNFLAISRHICS